MNRDDQRELALVEGRRIIDEFEARGCAGTLLQIVIARIDCLNGSFEQADDGTQTYRLLDGWRVAADLRAAGFSNWADWFEARHYTQPSTSPTEVAIDLLIGRVAGCYFGLNPGMVSFSAAEQLMCAFTDGWRDFSTSASKTVAEDAVRERALIDLLQDKVNSFTTAPRRIGLLSGTNPCAMVESFRKRPRLADVWQEQPLGGMIAIEHSIIFDVLHFHNRRKFLDLLDSFPHPEPPRQIMAYMADHADLTKLLSLLEIAPDGFDSKGNWLVAIKTPFLVISNITNKLSTLALESPTNTNEISEKYKSAIHSVLSALTSRRDAVWLGYAWLQHLISAARSSRQPPKKSDKLGDEALCALLMELATVLPIRCDALEWVSAEDEIWRRERAVAAVAGAALKTPDGHKSVELLIEELLRKELLRNIGLEEKMSHGSIPESFLIGICISNLPSPDEWFSGLWTKLTPIRDRARHSTDWRDPASEMDHILISWALCGLNRIRPDTPKACSFWMQILRAVREVRLTPTVTEKHSRWCFAYRFLAGLLAARVNANPLDSAALGDLREFISHIFWIDTNLAEAISVMRAMDLPLTTIIEAAPDANMLINLMERITEEQADLDLRLKKLVGGGPRTHEKYKALTAELSAAVKR